MAAKPATTEGEPTLTEWADVAHVDAKIIAALRACGCRACLGVARDIEMANACGEALFDKGDDRDRIINGEFPHA